jgi:hypothetical protein
VTAIKKVFLDEVLVDGDGRGGPLSGGGDELRARVDGVAGGPQTGDGGGTCGGDGDPAVGVGGAAQLGQQSVVGDELWPDEQRGPANDSNVGGRDPDQPIVLNDKAGDGRVDDADRTGNELFSLVHSHGVAVGEQDHVVGPLPQQVSVRDGFRRSTEDAERLVAHLVAVAVRTVQQVPAQRSRSPGTSGMSSRSPVVTKTAERAGSIRRRAAA